MNGAGRRTDAPRRLWWDWSDGWSGARLRNPGSAPEDALRLSVVGIATTKILICDDEPHMRELYRVVLGGDFEFHEVDDGSRALEVAREVEPDLLVLDWMLPGASGSTVMAQFRADSRLQSTPILVISAWPHLAEEALRAGADGFLAKPFDPQTLKETAADLVRRQP